MTKHTDNTVKYWLRALGIMLTIAVVAGPASICSAQDDHDGHDHGQEMHDDHSDHDEHENEKDHDDHAEHQEDEGDHDDHAEHQEHDDHDDHAEHDEDEDEGLRLTPAQIKRFGIKLETAGAGSLASSVSLPGEVVFNEDRVVHMVPRVSGIARKVTKSVGDQVTAGEVLAILESRELADAKAEYLAAKARLKLAEKTHAREDDLRKKGISSEQEFLQAEQDHAEARIVLKSAEQKLRALGLTKEIVAKLDHERDESITRYEILSPISGVVTEKHLSLGESVAADADILTVVDTSSVWINLAVYAKDLSRVKKGQEVLVKQEQSDTQAQALIAMVTPFVHESTRTASARVVLDNKDGRWVPGTFVTGSVNYSSENVRVVIPRLAIQVIEDQSVVFVEHEGALEMAPVKVGRSDRTRVEVLEGLEPGTKYVVNGAFELKATFVTSNMDSHAGHGH